MPETCEPERNRGSREANVRSRENFGSDFELLTGHSPFPWQRELLREER